MYTSLLTFPTATSHPSPDCLQWSADGQLCYTTKSTAYILSPDHGINFDTESTSKPVSDPVDQEISPRWFKTIIPLDECVAFKWPEYSQAWGTLSLGSVDNSLHTVAISPSAVSSSGGCIYATLTSNMDVALWSSGKHYLKGEWHKLADVTPILMDAFSAREDAAVTASVLQAQTMSIEWTPQASFNTVPVPIIDGSILILGNRAGSITFLRCSPSGALEILSTLVVSQDWITHLAFATWESQRPGTCEGYLAYGTSRGAVGLVKIAQRLLQEESTPFSQRYTINADFHHGVRLIHEPAKASITCMKWVDVHNRSPILVWSYPGLLKLFSAAGGNETSEQSLPWWTGLITLRIPPVPVSYDSSPLHLICGIAYVARDDTLVLAHADGSFRCLTSFSTTPTWKVEEATQVLGNKDSDKLSGLASVSVSKRARKAFARAEQARVDNRDLQHINGMQSYDHDSSIIWVYESTRPSDFSYKHDAKHSGTIVVASLWASCSSDQEHDAMLMSRLQNILQGSFISRSTTPLALLRPFFFHLRDPDRLSRVLDKLLDLLQVSDLEGGGDAMDTVTSHAGITFPSFELPLLGIDEQVMIPSWDENMKLGLRAHLFGWRGPMIWRIKLGLADFAWKWTKDGPSREKCGIAAARLVQAISVSNLVVVLRYLVAVAVQLTIHDASFVHRALFQASAILAAPGTSGLSPATLHELDKLSQALIRGTKYSSAPTRTPEEEPCPACAHPILFGDPSSAICPNGHVWARCSITTFVLSTASVRTCVGCARKAFHAPVAPCPEEGSLGKSLVITALLGAVDRCWFCANRFVSIV